jgi:tetraacyldisaccharide 4'-kinase
VWDIDRAAAGKSLVLDHRCDVVVLDDGFQHRRLHRTIDFLLIDALNPFGYGYLLPRGLLREPVSALARATAVIVTRANLASRDQFGDILARVRAIDPEAKVAQAVHRPISLVRADDVTEPVESLQGKKVFAFCGIGNPHAFITTLSHLGAKVVGMRSYDDHHEYADADMQSVFEDASTRGAELVVTTRKDRVKTGWQEGRRLALAELRVEFELTAGKEAVEGMLDWMIRSFSSQAGA